MLRNVRIIVDEDSSECVGYCEGCEETGLVLVDDDAEYCSECWLEKQQDDALDASAERYTRRAENGWADA